MTFPLYPVRNNAPLEFLTGFTSKVINDVAQYLSVFIVAKQRFSLISRAGQEIT